MGALERPPRVYRVLAAIRPRPVGFFLANLAVLVLARSPAATGFPAGDGVSRSSLSIIMVGVGLYIRLGSTQTPTFSRLLAENRIERAPVLEVIKRQPKSIILVALAKMGEMSPLMSMGLRPYLWDDGPGKLARPASQRSRRRRGNVILYGPHRRVFVGPHRPQAYVSDRLGRHRVVRVHLFCAPEHSNAKLDLYRHCVVFCSNT